jgi:DNA-binding CsgD family transcriptional regulator
MDQSNRVRFSNLRTELSPRLRQTLECLLEGDGEKQVAARLGLSRHTVHDYVTALYRRLDVSSRPELMALCLSRGRPTGGM